MVTNAPTYGLMGAEGFRELRAGVPQQASFCELLRHSKQDQRVNKSCPGPSEIEQSSASDLLVQGWLAKAFCWQYSETEASANADSGCGQLLLTNDELNVERSIG